jgi:hypothetical protein
MIVNFPLLVDDTISSGIIPGVCKALEKYTLTYKLDQVLKWGGLPADSRLISFAKDSIDLLAKQNNLPVLGLFGENYIVPDMPYGERLSEGDKPFDISRDAKEFENKPGKHETVHGQFDDVGGHDKKSQSYSQADSAAKAIVHFTFDNRQNIPSNASQVPQSIINQISPQTDWNIVRDIFKDVLKNGKDKKDSWDKELLKKAADSVVSRSFINVADMFKDAVHTRPYDREKEADKRVWSGNTDRKVDVKTTDIGQSLSIEPTWATTQSRKGTAVIGVKVFPYTVDSAPFVNRITRDMAVNLTDELLERYERGVTRAFYRIMRNIKIPILRRLPLEKDPFNDIIYARSIFGGNVYCMLNLTALKDDDTFKDQGGVDKLYRMGWNGIMIADDVTKVVTFCMKETQGGCSMVPYSYIYASIGQQYSKAYGDLEDLKKSMSPIFSRKISNRKLFEQAMVLGKLADYSGIKIPCLNEDCNKK